MKWQEMPLEDSDDILLRQATQEDYETSVRLSVEAFGLDEEDARAMESHHFADKTGMFMIDVNEETVGKLRVSRKEGQAWIYGFSILPEHQGRGIGRKALRRIVKEQSSAGYSVRGSRNEKRPCAEVVRVGWISSRACARLLSI